MEVNKESLNLLMKDGKKLSRSRIAEILGVSDSAARDYKALLDNMPLLMSGENGRNVLIIGDLHLPFEKNGYFEHCKAVKEKYGCNEIVFIGDIIDNHYSSFHDSDPDGMGAGKEMMAVRSAIKRWKKEFPKAKVCLCNHDLIPNRKAFNAGLSKKWIKSIKDVFRLKGWDFADSFLIDNVLYEHGVGGKAQQRSKRELVSLVQGHYHTDMYIHYTVGQNFKIFGMQVGCGVDGKAYAMEYSKYFPKPAIGCGVVLNNGTLPILEPMEL